MHNDRELARIRGEYKRRDQNLSVNANYSPDNPAHRFALQNRQKATLELLRELDITSLENLKILEVGSGHGNVLLEYLSFGTHPDMLHGCDLIFNRLRHSKLNSPGLHLTCADAQNLPFPERSFDLVSQYTVFSSVLDTRVKINIATEMKRLLKPDGVILWYDFWLNPTNPAARGVRPPEIRKLFPGCRYIFQKITLAPPITRCLIQFSKTACSLLENLKLFNSHYLAAVIPQRS